MKAINLSKLNTDSFVKLIPRSTAFDAHRGTSWVPDERAEQERRNFSASLYSIIDGLRCSAKGDPAKLKYLEEQLPGFVRQCTQKYIEYLDKRSGVVSAALIAGPSNFNNKRNNKANRASDRALAAYIEFKDKEIKKIKKGMFPELQPIKSGDDDAVERLNVKLVKKRDLLQVLRAANKIVRSRPKNTITPDKLNQLKSLGYTHRQAQEMFTPDFAGRYGIPSYEITNLAAEVNRIEDRIEQLQQAKSTNDVCFCGSILSTSVDVEFAHTNNRLRLTFNGKPGLEVRTLLKANGFKWAPSLCCWQTYINTRSEKFVHDNIVSNTKSNGDQHEST